MLKDMHKRTGIIAGRCLSVSETGSPVLDEQNVHAIRGLLSVVVTLGIVAFLALMGDMIRPAWWEHAASGGVYTSGMMVFLSLAIIVLLKKPQPIRAGILLNLGLTYEVIYCGVVSYGEIFCSPTPGTAMNGLSFVCVIILLFPMFVPYPMKKVIITSVLAAATGPLLAAVFYLIHGWPAQDGTWTLLYYIIPNFLVVWIVGRTATQIHLMTREVRKARTMGSYELDELLGKGGMGEVWRGDHQLLRRPAAVKLIRPENLGMKGTPGSHMFQRFEREAQATAALHSPHTIQLYDFGATESGDFYYVMELLDGFNMEQLVNRFGPLPWERVACLLHQVCDSLWDAHRSGMIHRDIKPANIYLCRYGHTTDFVKVLDFGLVKESGASSSKDVSLTAATAIAGTPAFISPEAGQGVKLDSRADIYALGCVGYWLLTGDLVFDRETPMQTVIAHIQEKPAPFAQRTEMDVPDRFADIIMACLEKDPDLRPQTARELAEMIETCGWEEGWNRERADAWWDAHSPESTDKK